MVYNILNSTRSLYKHLCPAIKEYLGSGQSKPSKTLLFGAYDKRMTLKGFNDFNVLIDLPYFDWEGVEQDRNWWWQLQALPFLNWCVDAYFLLDPGQQKQALTFSQESLLQWYKKASGNKNSPLVWHDHASAFRLRNLVRWLSFLSVNDLVKELVSHESDGIIMSLVKQHVNFLCEANNYSRHTNHGFDQMLILYTVSLLWLKTDYLYDAGNLACARLLDELDFAFTDQGVHKENSPGYQKFMLSRLKQLQTLEYWGDQVCFKAAKKKIQSCKYFLSVITMPNGELPMIGDTTGHDRGILLESEIFFEVLDFSKSGYFIVRGLSETRKAFHMVFKCTHLSDYHRHDDDLSIHLFYGSEVILGDGGLLYYHESDKKRKFLRSAHAHTTVFPKAIPAARKHAMLSRKPLVYSQGNYSVVGETSAYGGIIRRTIHFDQLAQGLFSITDELVEPVENMGMLLINFILPTVNEWRTEDNATNMFTEKHQINIRLQDSCKHIKVAKGWHNNFLESAILSEKYGKLVDTVRVCCLCPVRDTVASQITTQISILPL